jgi:hypothetical protein
MTYPLKCICTNLSRSLLHWAQDMNKRNVISEALRSNLIASQSLANDMQSLKLAYIALKGRVRERLAISFRVTCRRVDLQK